jgi:hypothetical protein
LPGLLAHGASETHGCLALPSVRPFAPAGACWLLGRLLAIPAIAVRRLLRPLLTSRPASAPASPFRAQGEISPGKGPRDFPRTVAGSTPPGLWSRELRGHLPARPGRRRLVSGSCSSTRGFAPRFFQRRPRGHHLAVRSGSLRPGSPEDLHLLATPMLGTQKERPRSSYELRGLIGSGSDLLSRTVSRAVPSALEGLTSVFGMGTGVNPSDIATGNFGRSRVR